MAYEFSLKWQYLVGIIIVFAIMLAGILALVFTVNGGNNDSSVDDAANGEEYIGSRRYRDPVSGLWLPVGSESSHAPAWYPNLPRQVSRGMGPQLFMSEQRKRHIDELQRGLVSQNTNTNMHLELKSDAISTEMPLINSAESYLRRFANQHENPTSLFELTNDPASHASQDIDKFIQGRGDEDTRTGDNGTYGSARWHGGTIKNAVYVRGHRKLQSAAKATVMNDPVNDPVDSNVESFRPRYQPRNPRKRTYLTGVPAKHRYGTLDSVITANRETNHLEDQLNGIVSGTRNVLS
jgi:hypothetical protein